MVAAAPTQDMPPRGGYAPIIFKRIPASSFLKGWHWFAGVIIIKCAAIYHYSRIRRRIKYEEIENRSARLAIQPLLFAEKERGVMRQMRLNRAEEEAIMSEVAGWEVGKFYNEPIFKTQPADKYVSPSALDYFVHAPYGQYRDRVLFHWFH